MSVEAFGLEISFKGSRRGLRCELMPASFLGVSKRKIQDVSGSMQRKEGASARGCRGRGENMEKGLGAKRAERCGHTEAPRIKPPHLFHICHDSVLFNLGFSSLCRF